MSRVRLQLHRARLNQQLDNSNKLTKQPIAKLKIHSQGIKARSFLLVGNDSDGNLHCVYKQQKTMTRDVGDKPPLKLNWHILNKAQLAEAFQSNFNCRTDFKANCLVP